MFGVLFPNRSFPLDASRFAQVGAARWLLDMSSLVGERPPGPAEHGSGSNPEFASLSPAALSGDGYEQVREVCLFLLADGSLPPEQALALYVAAPASADFQYRGAVYVACPSAVLPLLWPPPPPPASLPGAPAAGAQIGVSVVPLATLPALSVGWQARAEEMARRVGENVLNFMQSFGTPDAAGRLVVPADALDRWFQKFQDRAKRDPEYLNRFML
eukprot:SM000077S21537  [mRNA]  locus=s77:55244:56418:- [translate_table: standard]